MTEEVKCPICGKATFKFYGNYRKDKLCSTHATELKKGEIEILDYHLYLKEDDDQNLSLIPIYTDKNKQILVQSLSDELIHILIREKMIALPTTGYDNCILCNEKSKGYAFCKNCYYKFPTATLFQKFLDYHINTEERITTDKINEPIDQSSKEEEKLEPIDKDNITEQEDNLDNIQLSEENNNNIENDINNTVIINENNKSRCITCGRHTEGLLFCNICYQKYKNKELLFKITNCTNIELLDEDYEGRYTCKDGHIVKSKSERDIDNYLFEHGIPHAYERELPYGAKDKEILHPDFYLPNYLGSNKHVYIEHWGYNENNISYTKTKKFKLEIYKKLGITLVCTDEKKDASKIDTALDRKLNKPFIKENEINQDQ